MNLRDKIASQLDAVYIREKTVVDALSSIMDLIPKPADKEEDETKCSSCAIALPNSASTVEWEQMSVCDDCFMKKFNERASKIRQEKRTACASCGFLIHGGHGPNQPYKQCEICSKFTRCIECKRFHDPELTCNPTQPKKKDANDLPSGVRYPSIVDDIYLMWQTYQGEAEAAKKEIEFKRDVLNYLQYLSLNVRYVSPLPPNFSLLNSILKKYNI